MARRREVAKKSTTGIFLPLVYAGVVITTLIGGVVAYEVYDERKQIMLETQRELRVVSSTSALQLENHLDTLSQVLTAAADKSASYLANGSNDKSALKPDLLIAQLGTSVSYLVIVDATGTVVAHTRDTPVPAQYTPGKEAAWILQASNSSETQLVGPISTEIDDGVVFFAAKKIVARDGAYLGVVLTPLDLYSVALAGKDAARKDGLVVSVLNSNNKNVIVRFPEARSVNYLRDYSNAPIFTQISNQRSGAISGTSPIDGIKRLMVFDQAGKYPLVAISEMDIDSMAAKWHGSAARIVFIGYFSLSVVLLLLVVIYRQIRRLANRTEDVAESEQRFDRVIQQLTDALYVRDRNGRIIVANLQFARFFGTDNPQSLIGLNINDINPSAVNDLVNVVNKEVLGTRGKPFTLEQETTRPDGTTVPIEYTLASVEIGGEEYILGQMRDLSARRRYEEQLFKQATYDDVTGLPNRRLFIDRLSHTLHSSKREGKRSAVMFIDLDHFKRINDTLGHPVGDQLLISASRRLSDIARETDTLARFGGDEFVLLVPELTSTLECRALAARIVEAFQQPFELAGRSVCVTASVGISISPEDGSEADTLLQHTDTAMYAAKSGGRNTFCFFDAQMNTRVQEMLQIDEKVRTALDRGEIRALYQPIIDPLTERLVKAEALARWSSKELGEVPPDKFIPVAEENGMIIKIGEWILMEACRNAAKWAREMPNPITISVNVSAKQFNDPTFVDTVFSVLEETGLPAHLLELEMTERILISDDETTLETLGALHELGVGLSLDDFGTGYSSLSYLTKFPLNAIKIDRSFVRDVDRDLQKQNITKAIIALANSLDLKLVAEGVETHEQVEKLVLFGCQYLQGYYFGQPMSSDDILQFKVT